MAKVFRQELSNFKFDSLRVTLHGSLAMTGGHLTPNAIIAGLMGYDAIQTPIEDIQQATAKLIMDKGMGIHKTWLNLDNQFIHLLKT